MKTASSLASLPVLLCLGFLAGGIAGFFAFLGIPMPAAVALEEALKACALLAALALGWFSNKLKGVASGLSMGIGFGLAEFANYFVVFYYHDLSLFFLRLPPLAMHALTASILGCALYYGGKNKWLLLLGFAAAVCIHLAFNYLIAS